MGRPQRVDAAPSSSGVQRSRSPSFLHTADQPQPTKRRRVEDDASIQGPCEDGSPAETLDEPQDLVLALHPTSGDRNAAHAPLPAPVQEVLTVFLEGHGSANRLHQGWWDVVAQLEEQCQAQMTADWMQTVLARFAPMDITEEEKKNMVTAVVALKVLEIGNDILLALPPQEMERAIAASWRADGRRKSSGC
eukprot:TRINITY_DN42285_c0_g3_i1.p1 TRINITY_DN42285_c0_g3~~TRINITY_DN42285_c0_g3_i1.p1  ORF type:complete len:192 (-),score=22.61 TRINITY_DN42285_c0_g3_i1:422-997(-)